MIRLLRRYPVGVSAVVLLIVSPLTCDLVGRVIGR